MNNMKKLGLTGILIVVFLMFTACHERQQNQSQVNDSQLKESLEKANRYMVSDEEEDIKNYIDRHKLDMVATGTGLRYQIIQQGEGEQIRPGQTVTVDYVLKNIMGDVIYSGDNEGIMTFDVGCGDVVSGLDEALTYLHKGDVAKIIIPSHLGYGLLGDQKSIPERATLIYVVKIVDVK